MMSMFVTSSWSIADQKPSNVLPSFLWQGVLTIWLRWSHPTRWVHTPPMAAIMSAMKDFRCCCRKDRPDVAKRVESYALKKQGWFSEECGIRKRGFKWWREKETPDGEWDKHAIEEMDWTRWEKHRLCTYQELFLIKGKLEEGKQEEDRSEIDIDRMLDDRMIGWLDDWMTKWPNDWMTGWLMSWG